MGVRSQNKRTSEDREAPSLSTAERLLEVAGQLFAEKGFERTTGKEICEQAGANSAAINYYYGSVEGLYTAVLREAPKRLIRLESLFEAVVECESYPEKLRAFVAKFIHMLAGPAHRSWAARVLAREMTAPSSTFAEIEQSELLPKSELLQIIVGELMHLPSRHPMVARGCVAVIAPCFLLLVLDRPFLQRMFPMLDMENAESLVDQLVEFSLAGLERVAAAAQE